MYTPSVESSLLHRVDHHFHVARQDDIVTNMVRRSKKFVLPMKIRVIIGIIVLYEQYGLAFVKLPSIDVFLVCI